MRVTVKAGLFLSMLCFAAIPKQAQAISLDTLLASKAVSSVESPKEPTETKKTTPEPPVVTPAVAKPVEHQVQPGESLTSIAELHQITWTRLYDKNTQVSDPNVIDVGLVLIIPTPEEQLTPRDVPVAQPAATQQISARSVRQASPAAAPRATYAPGSSAGNTYSYGYCTYYAKSRRPDLPNNLGNANTWVARAAAQGIATGSSPQVGAIGQQGMHVVYVEAVNGDGTITISEMNYAGFGVISSRVASAGNFSYIY